MSAKQSQSSTENPGAVPQSPLLTTPGRRRRHRPLSVKQRRAIELKLAGQSGSQIAERLDVHRVTISGWFNKNENVIAEANRRLQEILAEDQDLVPVCCTRRS
jgi:hypothetical protein